MVARFDTAGDSWIADAVTQYDDFQVQGVPDRSALADTTLDQSGLTDEEIERLGVVPAE